MGRPSSTGFTGVSFSRGRRLYLAVVWDPIAAKLIAVGHYPTAEEAAHAYDQAAWDLRGWNGPLNFPERFRGRKWDGRREPTLQERQRRRTTGSSSAVTEVDGSQG